MYIRFKAAETSSRSPLKVDTDDWSAAIILSSTQFPQAYWKKSLHGSTSNFIEFSIREAAEKVAKEITNR